MLGVGAIWRYECVLICDFVFCLLVFVGFGLICLFDGLTSAYFVVG